MARRIDIEATDFPEPRRAGTLRPNIPTPRTSFPEPTKGAPIVAAAPGRRVPTPTVPVPKPGMKVRASLPARPKLGQLKKR